MLGHADRGDDRIDGEDEIDDGDLQNGGDHRVGDRCLPALLLAFDVLMHLARALDQEEQAAGDEDEVAPRKIVTGEAEEGRRQMNDIGNAAQHDDAEDERQQQPDAPRRQPLLGMHARHHQRDEDDVVDAEHDLHRAQGNEARPDMRVGQPVDEHHALGVRMKVEGLLRGSAGANSLAANRGPSSMQQRSPSGVAQRPPQPDARKIGSGDNEQNLHPQG